MSKILFSLVHCIHVSLCLIGFSYQVSELASRYLQFKTITKVSADISSKMKPPALHFCPRYVEILNLTKFNLDKNMSLSLNLSEDSTIFELQSLVTIEDLFAFTPSSQQVIESCVIRHPSSFGFLRFQKDECNKRFNVTKFYLLENVCYKLVLDIDESEGSYAYNRIAYALNFPGLFFSVDLNPIYFSSLGYFKAIATRTHALPENSIVTAPPVRRAYDGGESPVFNRFRVLYYTITYHRLPAPYDSNCRDYIKEGLRHSHGCINDCMTLKCLSTFDKVPYTAPLERGLPKRHVSALDFKNDTKKIVFHRLAGECEALCSQLECENLWTLTTVDSQPYKGPTRLEIAAPRQPSFVITHEPSVSFAEFVLFVSSCFGSWFGLSMLAINPLVIVRRSAEVLIRYNIVKDKDLIIEAGRPKNSRGMTATMRRLVVTHGLEFARQERELHRLKLDIEHLKNVSGACDYFEYVPPK